MDLEQRHNIGLKALQRILSIQGPQPLENIIDPEDLSRMRRVADDDAWIHELFNSLVSKNVITRRMVAQNRSHPSMGQNQVPYYLCRNRYFIQTLLAEASNGGNRLRQMIDPNWIPASPVREVLDTSKQPKLISSSSVSESDTFDLPELSHLKALIDISPQPEEPTAPVPTSSNETVELLKSLQDLMVYSVDLQNKLAENIIYIRDRGNKLHIKMGALTERLQALENMLGVAPPPPQLENLSELVNSLRSGVNDAVREAIASSDSFKLTQMAATVDRMAVEFNAIRELTLEVLGSGPKNG